MEKHATDWRIRQISASSICIFQTAVFSFADTAYSIYTFYIPPNNQTRQKPQLSA